MRSVASTALIEQSASPSPSLLNNAANVRLALGRAEEAVELYETAVRKSHRVVVLFNLSQAYGRLIQLDRQDLALAEAQVIDPVALVALTDLYGRSRRALVADLPVAMETIRVRLGRSGGGPAGGGLRCDAASRLVGWDRVWCIAPSASHSRFCWPGDRYGAPQADRQW